MSIVILESARVRAGDMTESSEPDHNIGTGQEWNGSKGQNAGTEGPDTRAEEIVNRLGDLYWHTSYGGQHAFESLVRTILSQNTSDAASQPAFDALMERFNDGDLADALAKADKAEIADVIEPAGLYNQKSEVIQRTATHVLETYGSADGFDRYVRDEDAVEVRDTLLTLKGVGPKTADCVLLFAGGREGVFPVDTHVYRIYRRLGIAPPDADHETVREVLEESIAPEKCGYGHTTSIQFGREYCTARDPVCLDAVDACPLSDLCERIGIDTVNERVVDPAQTVE